MDGQLPSEFENLEAHTDEILSGNSLTNFEGMGNVGEASSNNQVQSSLTNSHFEITKNTNLDLSGDSMKLILSGNVNCRLAGSKNKVYLANNTDTDLSGKENYWEASECDSVNIVGNNCNIKLNKNFNVTINSNDSRIQGKLNSNLEVNGDSHNLHVEETENHEFYLAESDAKHGKLNKLELIPRKAFRFMCTSGPKFRIGYVEAAQIVKDSYKLGIFQFTVENYAETVYAVTIRENENAIAPGSVVKNGVDPKYTVVRATSKAGEEQSLMLIGPDIEEETEGSKIRYKIRAR